MLNNHQAGAKHKSLGSRNFVSDGQSTAKGETRAHVSNYRTQQLPEEAGPEGVRGRPQRRPGGRTSEVGDRVGGMVEREPSSFSNCRNATVLDYCWATACPEKLLKAPSLKRMFTYSFANNCVGFQHRNGYVDPRLRTCNEAQA